jgi:hypothetical protein
VLGVLSSGVKLWVITDADRSATTLLLPEEYCFAENERQKENSTMNTAMQASEVASQSVSVVQDTQLCLIRKSKNNPEVRTELFESKKAGHQPQ